MNRNWIKNLAKASHIEGCWKLVDPNTAVTNAKRDLEYSLTDVYFECLKAADEFNLYRTQKNRLSILSEVDRENVIKGLRFILVGAQLHLYLDQTTLYQARVLLNRNEVGENVVRHWNHQFDPFGGLRWKDSRTGESMMMSQVLMTTFADICCLAQRKARLRAAI